MLNPWRSKEELGGTFLGHRVYLTAKARGEKSMPEKDLRRVLDPLPMTKGGVQD